MEVVLLDEVSSCPPLLSTGSLNANGISGPIGIVPTILLAIVWPKDNHSTNVAARPKARHLDYFGALLLVSGSVPLIVALQQAGSRTWSWNSTETTSLLTISIGSWIAFFVWEWIIFVHQPLRKIQAQLPFALVKNRVMISTIL